jgi:hypothetical protein
MTFEKVGIKKCQNTSSIDAEMIEKEFHQPHISKKRKAETQKETKSEQLKGFLLILLLIFAQHSSVELKKRAYGGRNKGCYPRLFMASTTNLE